jgi:uncharacterized membrane protein
VKEGDHVECFCRRCRSHEEFHRACLVFLTIVLMPVNTSLAILLMRDGSPYWIVHVLIFALLALLAIAVSWVSARGRRTAGHPTARRARRHRESEGPQQ